jgi:hypothetical protein
MWGDSVSLQPEPLLSKEGLTSCIGFEIVIQNNAGAAMRVLMLTFIACWPAVSHTFF